MKERKIRRASRTRSIVHPEPIEFMIVSNVYLTIFAFAMMGCVLATPVVTWVATRVGAIDRPDQFRRVHHGAIPRLGGLALAIGVAVATALTYIDGSLGLRAFGPLGLQYYWSLLVAALVVLAVVFVDDTRSLGPRKKLLGQSIAVVTLYLGGIQIRSIDVLSLTLDLGVPGIRLDSLGLPVEIAL